MEDKSFFTLISKNCHEIIFVFNRFFNHYHYANHKTTYCAFFNSNIGYLVINNLLGIYLINFITKKNYSIISTIKPL